MRLNSSFNGACCAAPAGLLGSYRGPPPIAFQRHWPDQSGYLDSSCAEAVVAVANVAAIVSMPIRIRTIMECSPCASVGNGASRPPAVDAKRYRSRRQGGPTLQPGSPRRNVDVVTSGSNFRRDAEGPQISLADLLETPQILTDDEGRLECLASKLQGQVEQSRFIATMPVSPNS